MTWTLLLTFVLLTGSPKQERPNPYLRAALAQIHALHEREALRTLDRALSWPHSSLSDLARAHLYRGLAFAGLAEEDKVVTEFRTALLMKPDLSLGGEVSPKIAGWWKQAHQRAAEASAGGKPPPPDRPALNPEPTEPAEASRPSAPLNPPASSLATPSLAPPSALTPAPAPTSSAEASASGSGHKWVAVGLGILAVAAVGSAIAFGLEAQNDARSAVAAPELGQAQASQHSATTHAHTANVLYGVSGGLALGAGLTLLF